MTNNEKDMLCAEYGFYLDISDEQVPHLTENDIIRKLKEQKNERV